VAAQPKFIVVPYLRDVAIYCNIIRAPCNNAALLYWTLMICNERQKHYCMS